MPAIIALISSSMGKSIRARSGEGPRSGGRLTVASIQTHKFPPHARPCLLNLSSTLDAPCQRANQPTGQGPQVFTSRECAWATRCSHACLPQRRKKGEDVMTKGYRAPLAGFALLLAGAAMAQQPPVRVRGQIEKVDGNT